VGGVSGNKKPLSTLLIVKNMLVVGQCTNHIIYILFIKFIRIGVSWINNASLEEMKPLFQESIHLYFIIMKKNGKLA